MRRDNDANQQSHEGDSEAPIFLVGFMGAGKTTVGRALAKKLGRVFFDLDDVITSRAGKSIRAIFDEMGEGEFRRLEREAIELCGDLTQAVIALGGGAYVPVENREILRNIGKIIWLDCPLEICLSRISGDPARPLAGSESEMKALLEKRRPAYASADFTVETGNRSPGEIASTIIRLIKG